jgi:outer membrane protein assembly factor BamB
MQVEEKPFAPEVPAPSAPPRPRPRLWPPVGLLVAYWGFVVGCDWLELSIFARFFSRLAAGALLALLLLVWWWVGSRTRLRERAYGFAVVVAGGLLAAPFLHPSVGGFGLIMGSLQVVLTVGLLGLVLALKASPFGQRLGLLAAVWLAWGSLTLIRIDGLTGDLHPDIRWRWSLTPEEAFLAEREKGTAQGADSALPDTGPLSPTPGDWPRFRGPHADGVVRGIEIETNWDANPPRLLWRRRVGPGWSSMVVVAGRLFTQEQRGQREAVVCYDAATGKEVWAHEDAGRFWETTAGAGPRATPAFAGGRLYALGASGLLSCLDAWTGKLCWQRDIKVPSGAQVPQWGFSGSPLVVGGLVIVFAGGEGSENLLAYRARSGKLAWTAPAGPTSYGSPQLARLGGEDQILLLRNRGLTAVALDTGAVLWEHLVPLPASAPRSLQPHALGGGQVLIASEADLGLALLDVKRKGGRWSAAERWVSREFKPAFNDFVVQGGHAYGFDGRIFACVELEEGTRRWKAGRYGRGQVLLLAEQSLLLVVSESGEVVLLSASPERHEVLGRFQAVKGTTWNHPVIAHGRLHVRNAEWMACYELGVRRGR